MGYRDIRVVVVSGDRDFYRAVEPSIASAPEIESVSGVTDLLAVQGRMNRTICNVVILDLDACSSTPAYLRQLVEKNKLLILLTAQSPSTAVPYRSGAANEFVAKPRAYTGASVNLFTNSVMTKIRAFSITMPTLNFHGMQKTVDTNQKIVAVASSTGGTEAVERILRGLPADIAPMLIVQHMPSGFTKFFADRLNSICPMEVREAKDNDYLQKGLVLIAPADKHMKLVRRGSKLMVECFIGTKMHGVMPAADVLFESVAPLMRRNVVGVILTGMGADGARGMMMMHNNGAKTIGQDQKSCVVYGMPKVAYDMGAIDMQLPLDNIAETILKLLQ